ncbi:MAG: DUF6428 family protein [Verrucomicrobiota bacterium]
MNITQFKEILKKYPDKKLSFILPNEEMIPLHFHITEVGHVKKEFIDCGGTLRSTSTCVLQAWTADDKDHSLIAEKLLSILKLAHPILPNEDLEVEVEFEAPYISQFPIGTHEVTENTLVFRLESKHADCLAKEKCGIEEKTLKSSCCSNTSGCC